MRLGRNFRIQALAFMVGFVLLATLMPANAVGLMDISGHVTNAAGTPLVNVAVSDGSQTVYTDATGAYTLEESQVNTYIVTASKRGLQAQSKVVTPATALNPVDFQLLYVSGISLSPRDFNNTPPKSITLTYTSYAPSTACVQWTDNASGNVVQLNPANGVSGGESTWTGQFNAAGLDDGVYAYTAVAKPSCSSSTQLTNVSGGSYNVDSVGPALTIVAPFDPSNTLLVSQRIVVRAQDFFRGSFQPSGSGINPSSISVSVRDVAGAETERRPAATYANPFIRSASVALTRGVEYRVTVTASDYAGNQGTASSRFKVLNEAVTTPAAQIDASIASVTPSSMQAGSPSSVNDLYIWDNVTASIGAFTVTLNETLHAGDGKVKVEVPLDQASVNYTVGGVADLPTRPVETRGTGPVSYSTDSTGQVVANVAAQQTGLGRVTALVPKGADAGSVRLSFSGHPSLTGFEICEDPTVGVAGCSPDPLATLGLHLTVQFDQDVAGGQWSWATDSGTNGAETTVLQGGQLDSNGLLNVSIASSKVAPVTALGHFVLRAYKRTADDAANVAVASVGLTADEIANGAARNLGAPASQAITVYSSEEAAEAVANCSNCSGDYTSTPEDVPAGSGTAKANPVQGAGDPDAVGPETVTDSGNFGSPACVQDDSCGLPPVVVTNGTPHNPGSCRQAGIFGPTVCTIAGRDIPGVKAFRGFSHRIEAMIDTFSVEVANKQTWQDGHRVKAGPFSVSGSTGRTYGGSTKDQFPKRGECWLSPYIYPCDYEGRKKEWGNDTWRWEKQMVSYCDSIGFFPACSSWVEEIVFEKTYDGGQREQGAADFTNYYASNSDIEGNRKGSWAQYRPGATRTNTLEQTMSYSYGASLSVNFPEAYGMSGSFDSSVTNETAQKVTNYEEFRNDGGGYYMTTPVTSPWDLGKWYRYDTGTSWRWEYYSCRYSSGWVANPSNLPYTCWPH